MLALVASEARRSARILVTDQPAPDVSLVTDPQACSLTDALFVQLVVRTGAPQVKKANWPTEVPDLKPIEGDPSCDVVTMVHQHGTQAAVFNRDGCILSVSVGQGTLTVSAAGATESVERNMAFIRSSFPHQPPRHLEVPFIFWMHTDHGPRPVIRQLGVCAWADVADNYGAQTHDSLAVLFDGFHPARGGQLLLWHGDPGTGKTFAIRALAWEWRQWCDFHYIVDPDKFFEEADYMMGVLLQGHHYGAGSDAQRWRVFILEDTGEMIRADAKERVGQGLSRLLNVVDGLIGQGLRILLLLTTNERLGELHDAVARPGRCAIDVQFTPLPAEDAQAWLKRRGQDSALEASEPIRLAELFARLDDASPAQPATLG